MRTHARPVAEVYLISDTQLELIFTYPFHPFYTPKGGMEVCRNRILRMVLHWWKIGLFHCLQSCSFRYRITNIASIALNTTFGFFRTPLWPICKISTGLSDENTPLSWYPLCREGYSKSITSTRFGPSLIGLFLGTSPPPPWLHVQCY